MSSYCVYYFFILPFNILPFSYYHFCYLSSWVFTVFYVFLLRHSSCSQLVQSYYSPQKHYYGNFDCDIS